MSAYGRIGYGYLSNHQEDGTVNYIQENATHILFGLGAEYTGRKGLGVRAEGIYFDADIRYGQLAVVYRFGKPADRRPVLLVEQGRTVMPAFALHAAPATLASTAISSGPAVAQPSAAAIVAKPIAKQESAADLLGVLEGVSFESGSDVLTTDAKRRLDVVLSSLKQYPQLRFQVTAHTDSEGDALFNMQLSAKRAKAVARYLIKGGIPLARLAARAFGESRPIATNDTPEGRRQNRRVELIAID